MISFLSKRPGNVDKNTSPCNSRMALPDESLNQISMKIIYLVTCGLILTLASTFGKPVNSACPVKGRPADGRIAVSVKVSFCCQRCVAKFEKDPFSFLGKVAKSGKSVCPVRGRKVDKAATSLISVAVCCNGCKGKVEAEPRQYVAKIAKSGKGS